MSKKKNNSMTFREGHKKKKIKYNNYFCLMAVELPILATFTLHGKTNTTKKTQFAEVSPKLLIYFFYFYY